MRAVVTGERDFWGRIFANGCSRKDGTSLLLTISYRRGSNVEHFDQAAEILASRARTFQITSTWLARWNMCCISLHRPAPLIT